MEAASQAADQVVRLTLEGVEYAIRLTGKTAVHTAALAAALGKLAAEKTPVKVLSALRPCSRVDEN